MKIKYDITLMKFMSLFEKVTRVGVKDCFEDNFSLLHFVVDKGNMRKAIGKEGANIKKLSTLINRKVKVVEYDSNRERFIKRLMFPLKVEEVTANENQVIVKGASTEVNSKIIGRNATNLRNYENIVKRYFDLDEIRVVN